MKKVRITETSKFWSQYFTVGKIYEINGMKIKCDKGLEFTCDGSIYFGYLDGFELSSDFNYVKAEPVTYDKNRKEGSIMKISGEQLCGLTKSELYDEILEHRCPNKINVHFTYKDCMSGKARHCCCDCYRINLKGEYEVHLE